MIKFRYRETATTRNRSKFNPINKRYRKSMCRIWYPQIEKNYVSFLILFSVILRGKTDGYVATRFLSRKLNCGRQNYEPPTGNSRCASALELSIGRGILRGVVPSTRRAKCISCNKYLARSDSPLRVLRFEFSQDIPSIAQQVT